MENCQLAGLPDLKQENPFVNNYLLDWVKGLVTRYNLDGIRIDTVPEVPKWFWKNYGKAAGVFQMGEVFMGNPEYVGQYQGPLTGVFNYPMYFTIKDVFGSGKSMKGIPGTYASEMPHFKDMDALGLFVDNHDNARFMNQFNDV